MIVTYDMVVDFTFTTRRYCSVDLAQWYCCDIVILKVISYKVYKDHHHYHTQWYCCDIVILKVISYKVYKDHHHYHTAYKVLGRIIWDWADRLWPAITRAAAVQEEKRRDRCGKFPSDAWPPATIAWYCDGISHNIAIKKFPQFEPKPRQTS